MASSGRGPAAVLALYELLYVYEGQVLPVAPSRLGSCDCYNRETAVMCLSGCCCSVRG